MTAPFPSPTYLLDSPDSLKIPGPLFLIPTQDIWNLFFEVECEISAENPEHRADRLRPPSSPSLSVKRVMDFSLPDNSSSFICEHVLFNPKLEF